MILGIIPCLMYAALMVYIANLSLLFVNYFFVSQHQVGYYQAAIMFAFLVFSFVAAILLKQITIVASQRLGLWIISIASISLDEFEILIVLSPSHWGLGADILDELIDKAKSEFSLNKVYILLPETRKSFRWVERKGFVFCENEIFHGESFKKFVKLF